MSVSHIKAYIILNFVSPDMNTDDWRAKAEKSNAHILFFGLNSVVIVGSNSQVSWFSYVEGELRLNKASTELLESVRDGVIGGSG